MAYQGHIVIPTSHPDAENVIETIETGLVLSFGGYSRYEGTGGWDGESGVVEENHVRLVANLSDEDHMSREQFMEHFRIDAEYVRDMLDEEAVLIEIRDVDMELV